MGLIAATPPSITTGAAVFAVASTGTGGSAPSEFWAYSLFGPCREQPVGGFGRLWEQDAAVRDMLGCARGPEHPVRVRERREDSGVPEHPTCDYWLEDSTPIWWSLWREGSAPTTSVHAFPKTARPWTDPPDRVVDGASESFAGGSMLFVREPDGRERILALGPDAIRAGSGDCSAVGSGA